jgi:hypothetical protein
VIATLLLGRSVFLTERLLRCKFSTVMPSFFLTTLQVLRDSQNTDRSRRLSRYPGANRSGTRGPDDGRMRLFWMPYKLSHGSIHRTGLLGLRELEQRPSCEQLHFATADRLLPKWESTAQLHHSFSSRLHPERTACARKASRAGSSCLQPVSGSAIIDFHSKLHGRGQQGGQFSSCPKLG